MYNDSLVFKNCDIHFLSHLSQNPSPMTLFVMVQFESVGSEEVHREDGIQNCIVVLKLWQ
jgi:hypothetical protein